MALSLAGFSLLLGALRRLVPFLWLSAFFAGAALFPPQALSERLLRQLSILSECTGWVVDLPEPTAKKLSFTVEVETLAVRVLAYGSQDLSVYPGQKVRLFGRYGVPEPEGYREYLARRGIYGLFWAERVEILAESPGGVLFWAAQARQTLRGFLSKLPEKAYALLSALVLGSRGLLSAEEKDAFRQAGVAHLLALSGLHVGILVTGGWFLLGLFRVPKAWRQLVLIPLVALYVLLGGLRVSLLRAALMFGVLAMFWIFWERGWVARRWLDPLQGLSFTAILVVLIWPWSSQDAAFQLSFSATAGIVLLFPSWSSSSVRRGLPRVLVPVGDILAVTVCAQIGVLPFLGATFGYLTPYGFLANLLLVPWTAVLIWAGILGLPFLAIPQTQVWAGRIVGWLSESYLWLVGSLAKLPGAALPVGEGFGLWYLLAVLAILILRASQEEFLWPPGLKAWPG